VAPSANVDNVLRGWAEPRNDPSTTAPALTEPATPAGAPPEKSSGDFLSLHSVGRGTAILIVGTSLLFLFGFLSRVLIARTYSQNDWGVFSLALALSGFLSIVALLGFDQALARALAFERHPAIRRAIIRYALVISSIASIASSAAVFVLAPQIGALFHIPGEIWVIELFAFTVGMGVMCLILAAIFQGFEDTVPNALFNQVINPGLFVAFVGAAIVLHLGFQGVVVGYVLSDAIALAGLVVYTSRKLPRLPIGDSSPERMKAPTANLWRLSAALWGVGTLAYVTAYVDTLILGVFRPATVVGAYAAIMTLGRVLLISNGTLTYIYLPVAARLSRDGNFASIRSTYMAGTRWVLLVVTPGCLLMFLLPGLCLSTVFGSTYAVNGSVLQILVVPAFLAVLVGPSSACLAGMGRYRLLLGTTISAAAANIALSFALIPSMGLVGAAISWGVARALYPGLGWIILLVMYRVNPFSGALLKPLGFSLAATTPLYLWAATLHVGAWALVPLYGAGLLIYLVGLLLTRSVIPGDLAVAHFAENILGRPLPRIRSLMLRFGGAVPAGLPTAGEN
jgi:O-antigen/teichoic acid export membrane protein